MIIILRWVPGLLVLFQLLVPAGFVRAQSGLYTLVDGLIVAPESPSPASLPGELKIGVSGFYYRFGYRPQSSGWLPYPVLSPIQDALVNLFVGLTVLPGTELKIMLPLAPDWLPNLGANKAGIGDLTLSGNFLWPRKANFRPGISLIYKLNTSTHHENPNWYGTNCPAFYLRLLGTAAFGRLAIFVNGGTKKVRGNLVRHVENWPFTYTYSNTWLGSLGGQYRWTSVVVLGMESNFETANKREVPGCYWDLGFWLKVTMLHRLELHGKIGKNLTGSAPDFYFTAGSTFIFNRRHPQN